MISDFDCAYELAYNVGPPKPKDYRGTWYYMAPDIASKRCIRYEADSWGVGTVMACLLTDRCRPEVSSDTELKKCAQQGKFKVPGFQNFTAPLRTFLKFCFAYNPTRRPFPLKMKKLRIFRNVNWETTEMRWRSPPFQLSDFHQLTDMKKFPFDPSCNAILERALARHMPRFPANFYYSRDPLDINKLDAVAPNLDELSRSGMTPHRIRQLLEDFNFVNERGLHNGELS